MLVSPPSTILLGSSTTKRINGSVKSVAIKDAVGKKRVKAVLWIAGHARNLHGLGRVHFVLD